MKEAETAEVHVYQGSNSLEVVLAELERVVICKGKHIHCWSI